MKINWKHPEGTLEDVLFAIVADGLCNTKAEAMKLLRKKMPPESYYQKKIMDALKAKATAEGMKCVIWKDQAGMYQRGGVSDVQAIIGGVHFSVEVKRPLLGEPSELQLKFIDHVNAAGGVAGVAVYPEDLETMWRRAEMIRRGRQ